MQHFVRRSAFVPFRHVWGDVRREFLQRLYVVLHGTILDSYNLRDALQEGNVDVVACLHAPRGKLLWAPPPLFSLLLGGFHRFAL
jgi:hypothetical protein